MQRPLYQIAKEIEDDFVKKNYIVSRGFNSVKPYLRAMKALSTIQGKYGLDSGKSIVLYFLANAGAWRGETARRIKAELKLMLKEG